MLLTNDDAEDHDHEAVDVIEGQNVQLDVACNTHF